MVRLLIVSIAVTLAHPTVARAAFATSCSSCESCTRALASPGALAEVTDDVVHSDGGPCIVIRGAGAQLDGLERDLRALGGADSVGVQIEADGVLLKNLHVMGAAVGIRVERANRVTLFHNVIEATSVGVQAVGTSDLRVTRSLLRGGAIGVSFGASGDTCPASPPLENRAAVITGTHIEGATVGIAACDASPIVRGSTIVRNGTGILLGTPRMGDGPPGAAGPWDSCVCAPDLAGVSAGTALFFSSGCHACQTHEAWLPELQAAGHDIVVRATGLENAEASRVFDAFVDQCAPQVTDAVGIPGCVPNYVCLSDDRTNKVRDGENALTFETQIGTKDDLAAYERACRAAAERSYAGPSCVSHALIDNVICENTAADVRGGPSVRGLGNACGRTEGWAEDGAGRCGACPGSIATPPVPAARVRERAAPPVAQPAPPPPAQAATEAGPSGQPSSVPGTSSEVAVDPVTATDQAPTEATAPLSPPVAEAALGTGRSPRFWLVVGAGVLGLLLVVGLIWLRWEDRS